MTLKRRSGRPGVATAAAPYARRQQPAHPIQFCDLGPDGKAVAKLSASPRDRPKSGLEPNATEYVRKLWERSLNSVLKSEGYEFRVDRRNNLERGLERPRDRVA